MRIGEHARLTAEIELLRARKPGVEVVLIEPFYDSYPATLAMAGGTLRTVRLRAPDFRLPVDELRRAVNYRTRLILLNTPHNPTGRVFDDAELWPIEKAAFRWTGALGHWWAGGGADFDLVLTGRQAEVHLHPSSDGRMTPVVLERVEIFRSATAPTA